jgi:TMEM175 potassium channel family protein
MLMSSTQASFSKARFEAFSDSVMAVIITIMVLDLRAPKSAEPAALLRLWPSLAIYLVSFSLTTIYWVNHHSLMMQARRVTTGLLWANSGLLFCASLIPFATAYVAETRLAPLPTAVYAGLQCICGIAFNVMFRTIVQQRDDAAFRRRAKIRQRQNLVAVGVYAVSALVALVSPVVAVLLFTAVSVAYVAPPTFLGAGGENE